VHQRGSGGLVGVKVMFTIQDLESLDRIKRELMREKVHVTEISVEGRKYYTRKTLTFLFIGHVIDTDIRDTIDRINDVGLVSEISVSMTDPDEKSSVIMLVEFDKRKHAKLMETVEAIQKEKKLSVVTSIDGE
jgi:ACT domain-containing protein